MSLKTSIGWCDMTWNPVWGCLTGCEYCYARRIAKRFWKRMFYKEASVIAEENAVTLAKLKEFKPVWLESNYRKEFPTRSCRIFVNSMSDIYWWKEEWLWKVVDRIKACPEHTFIFLTKFPDIYIDWYFPDNCWLGVTFTGEDCYPAHFFFDNSISGKRFISFEPLLSNPSCWYYHGMKVDWVIIGAQTNPYKPPKREWIENLVQQCRQLNIPIFMKENLRQIWDGELIQEFPNETKQTDKKSGS